MMSLYRNHRWLKKLMFIVATAPLFQLTQCQTGFNQVLTTTANNLPATYFQVLNSIALLPLQLILGLPIGGGSGMGDSGSGF
jgi:hypothetical protein